ncbi:MAG: signal peptidase I [Cytophagales bacterium]|nr:signal peptidase I [Armatimonadota bacterium]
MDERVPTGAAAATTLSDSLPIAAAAPLDPVLESRLVAVRAAEERRGSLAARIKRERRVLLPILGLCLLALPNFGMAKVQGHSMEPTYTTGDSLVLLKTFRLFAPVKVGDIVIVKLKHGANKGEEIVKRVVFVQNEKGNALWPRYLETGRGRVRADSWFPEYTGGGAVVPIGSLMVMGDNTYNSLDSRDFGPVFDYELLGKVLSR